MGSRAPKANIAAEVLTKRNLCIIEREAATDRGKQRAQK
jgi:hypothetical protein